MKKLQLNVVALVFATVLISSCSVATGLTTAVVCGVTGGLAAGLSKNDQIGKNTADDCRNRMLAAFSDRQTRTVEQDQKLYGYTASAHNTSVQIRNATASPEVVRAGDILKLAVDYSVMAPSGTRDVDVVEYMMLKRDGQVLKPLSQRSIKRPLGGSAAEVDFTIPAKMPSGTYVIEHKVQAGDSSDIRAVVFVVKS